MYLTRRQWSDLTIRLYHMLRNQASPSDSTMCSGTRPDSGSGGYPPATIKKRSPGNRRQPCFTRGERQGTVMMRMWGWAIGTRCA